VKFELKVKNRDVFISFKDVEYDYLKKILKKILKPFLKASKSVFEEKEKIKDTSS
jgi:hypothetical protein